MTLRLQEILPTLAALKDGRLLFAPHRNYLQPFAFLLCRLCGRAAFLPVGGRERLAALAAVSGEASWLQRKTTEVILVLFLPSSASALLGLKD